MRIHAINHGELYCQESARKIEVDAMQRELQRLQSEQQRWMQVCRSSLKACQGLEFKLFRSSRSTAKGLRSFAKETLEVLDESVTF